MDVLQTVLGIEAIDFTRWLASRIVPDPQVMSIRVENDGTLAAFFFKAVGVLLGLFTAYLGIRGGFLRFNHAKGFSIVVLKNIVSLALARCSHLIFNRRFLHDLCRIRNSFADVPAFVSQHLVDEILAGLFLVECQWIDGA